jgi:hypothetical protein
MRIVAGRPPVAAHGTRDTPARGAVFSLEASDRLDPEWRGTRIRGRIVEIVSCVEALRRQALRGIIRWGKPRA